VEICKIKIAKDTLQILVDSTAITTDDFEVIAVDEIGHDFSSSELWQAAKKESTKAYKKLKEIEFNLIHK
jgi:hypothetical protein